METDLSVGGIMQVATCETNDDCFHGQTCDKVNLVGIAPNEWNPDQKYCHATVQTQYSDCINHKPYDPHDPKTYTTPTKHCNNAWYRPTFWKN